MLPVSVFASASRNDFWRPALAGSPIPTAIVAIIDTTSMTVVGVEFVFILWRSFRGSEIDSGL